MRRNASNLGALTTALILSCALLSCAGGERIEGSGLTLRDPFDALIGANQLQLLVFAADGYDCIAAGEDNGRLSPNPSEAPDFMFLDAVVDLTFPFTEGEATVDTTVMLDPGSYAVLVRGRGTDPESMRENQIVATGCADDVAIEAGGTLGVSIEIQQVFTPGMCGDGRLSFDEQCEGTTPAPCTGCQTESYQVNTTASSSVPGAGWSDGGRLVVSFDNTEVGRGIRMRLLDEQAQPITTPTALSLDIEADIGALIPGQQTISSAASSGARLAVAFGDFRDASVMGGDVQVRFYDPNRTALGPPMLATADSAGAQIDPQIALMPDGTALVVFSDTASATGASGRIFAAASTTPAGAAAFPVLSGSPGSVTGVAVAASSAGFVVAGATGGDIYFERFGSDGASLGAAALATEGPAASGSQEQPAIGALSDGRFYVAWRDQGTTGVSGRAFATSGTATSEAIALSTGGDSAAPSIGATRERFFVTWIAGGNVMARLVDAVGVPAANREPVPSTDPFVVASGASSAVAVGGGPGSQGMVAAVWQTTDMNISARLYPVP